VGFCIAVLIRKFVVAPVGGCIAVKRIVLADIPKPPSVLEFAAQGLDTTAREGHTAAEESLDIAGSECFVRLLVAFEAFVVFGRLSVAVVVGTLAVVALFGQRRLLFLQLANPVRKGCINAENILIAEIKCQPGELSSHSILSPQTHAL
jgi:hypothetical protein